MNKETLLKLYVGLYGFVQIEMREVGLLNEDASPKPTKHMNDIEKDGVAIYDHLCWKVKGLSVERLHEIAEFTNDIVRSLINEEQIINNYLLAMMLFRCYLDDEAPKYEQIKMLPKVNRSIRHYEQLEGEQYKKIARTTHRCADNMWRVFTGKAQLSDAVRDAKASKYLRKEK